MRRGAWVLLAVVLAGCAGSGSAAPKPPTASVTATTLSAVEREVEAAYLKSWDVYADAALSFNTDALPGVYAEAALDVVRNDIATYRRNDTPARYRVEHHYVIEVSSTTTAQVRDRYVNHSVLLSPDRRTPIEKDPKRVIAETYTLKLVGGSWKVISIERSR